MNKQALTGFALVMGGLMTLSILVVGGGGGDGDGVGGLSYWGSRIQKLPFPGSSFVRNTLIKHLFKDRLWRMEFWRKGVLEINWSF